MQVFSFNLFDEHKPFTLRIPLDALANSSADVLRREFDQPGRKLASYLAGCLFVHHQQAYGTGPYDPSQNFAAFTMAVIGGIASVPGALLGALYLRGTQWFLPTDWQFLASGFGVLLVLLVIPGGLGGQLYKVRDLWLRSVAKRNGIDVPSLVGVARTADDSAPPPIARKPRPVLDPATGEPVVVLDPPASAADPDPADPDRPAMHRHLRGDDGGGRSSSLPVGPEARRIHE